MGTIHFNCAFLAHINSKMIHVVYLLILTTCKSKYTIIENFSRDSRALFTDQNSDDSSATIKV